MKKKIFAMLLVVSVLGVMVGGCGKKDEETVEPVVEEEVVENDEYIVEEEAVIDENVETEEVEEIVDETKTEFTDEDVSALSELTGANVYELQLGLDSASPLVKILVPEINGTILGVGGDYDWAETTGQITDILTPSNYVYLENDIVLCSIGITEGIYNFVDNPELFEELGIDNFEHENLEVVNGEYNYSTNGTRDGVEVDVQFDGYYITYYIEADKDTIDYNTVRDIIVNSILPIQ